MIVWARRIAEWVAAAIFFMMFVAFLLQVFFRYVLNSPLGWTYELIVVGYIWLIFWSCAFLLRERDHVTFGMIYLAAPAVVRRWLLAIGLAALLIAFGASLPATYDFISFMAIDRTSRLRWPFDRVYSVYLIFMLAVVIRCIITLWLLARPGWRSVTAHAEDPGPGA